MRGMDDLKGTAANRCARCRQWTKKRRKKKRVRQCPTRWCDAAPGLLAGGRRPVGPQRPVAGQVDAAIVGLDGLEGFQGLGLAAGLGVGHAQTQLVIGGTPLSAWSMVT